MICRLCLKPATDTLDIFDETGLALNVASLLSKYFWFEPKVDDPISRAICQSCWSKVNEFHDFYMAVKQAHSLLTERFSIKWEKHEAVETATTTNTTTAAAATVRVTHINNTKHSEATDPIDIANNQFVTNKKRLPHAAADEIADETVNDNESSVSNDDYSFDDEEFLPEIPLKSENIPHQAAHHTEQQTAQLDALALPTTRRVTRSTSTAASLKNADKKCFTKTIKKEKCVRAQAKTNNKSAARKYDYNVAYNKRMQDIDAKIARHMKLVCDICQVEQETFHKLCKHIAQVHHKPGYAVCCSKKFHKRSFLTDHIDKHNNPDKFKCAECDKTFSDKQCLRNHELLKHQPEEVMTHQCEHCPRKFSRAYLLEQHRVTHEERNLPCDKCDKLFQTASMLSTHIKMVHTNHGATMCDICAKVIRGRTAFARHQMEHAGITSPKVQCKLCGSWHKDKYALQRHIARHNTNNEKHVCNICGKISPNRGALLSHQRYVHASERKFKCSVCEKAFKKPVNLKEHMALHTGEILYKCSICPKTFNSNANMHSHRKKMHPKEWADLRQERQELRVANANRKETQNSTTKSIDSGNVAELAPKIITIKTPDDGKTHNIIVTTDDTTGEADESNILKNDRIVFTLCQN